MGSTLNLRLSRRIALVIAGVSIGVFSQSAGADPMQGCAGIGVLVNGSSQAVVDPHGRVCYDYVGATVSTTGIATGAIGFGAPPSDTASYDAQNRLATDTISLSDTISTKYDGDGRLIRSTEMQGSNTFVTTYSYDSLDREVQTTDPLGNVTSYGYDAMNRVTSEIDPGRTLSYTYDPQGNLITRHDNAGPTTTYTYDPQNRVTTVTDPSSHVTRFTYDTLNRVITTNVDGGPVTTYFYDQGLLRTVTDPNQFVTTFSYDARGNVIGVSDPQGTTSYVYTQIVPEPGSLALLGSGIAAALGFGARRRRRRQVLLSRILARSPQATGLSRSPRSR